jgi:hypothetical protein
VLQFEAVDPAAVRDLDVEVVVVVVDPVEDLDAEGLGIAIGAEPSAR